MTPPPRRRKRMLVAASLLLLYVVLCGVMYLFQDFLVFPGSHLSGEDVTAPAPLEIATLRRSSGAEFRVAEWIPEHARAVVLFFGGNGEGLQSGVHRVLELEELGVGAIAVEYPGYGKSDGPPSVPAFREAAEAAAEHAGRRAREKGVPLVVAGSSLGTFCAVHLAQQKIGDRMLLHAPPTSTAAVARHHYWWIPVGWLLRHRFDNLDPAERVRCPTLVVHGGDDGIVPPEMGRAVAEAIGSNAEFLEVPGLGHNDPILSAESPCGDDLRRFLQEGGG